jgi:hypothetical protein
MCEVKLSTKNQIIPREIREACCKDGRAVGCMLFRGAP